MEKYRALYREAVCVWRDSPKIQQACYVLGMSMEHYCYEYVVGRGFCFDNSLSYSTTSNSTALVNHKELFIDACKWAGFVES